MHEDLRKLSNLSQDIGNDLDLIQGAGGNTSVKINDELWVKASGYWLSDATQKDIFVPVNYKKIIDGVDKKSNDPVSEAIIHTNDTRGLRPSIETTLHAVMPQKYVAHTHSVNVIANTIAQSYLLELEEKLHGLSWDIVDYAKPGLPLTRGVRRAAETGADIIILANHGIVIAGNNIEELKNKIDDVEKRLHRSIRAIEKKFESKKAHDLIQQTEYVLPKYELIHSLALDREMIKIVSHRSLYPDHVVFIGPGPMTVMNLREVNRFFSSNNAQHKIVIVKDIGVVVHKTSSENMIRMLHCLANVLLRIKPKEKLYYLSEQDELDLSGWDAEKYRQSIEKREVS